MVKAGSRKLDRMVSKGSSSLKCTVGDRKTWQSDLKFVCDKARNDRRKGSSL